MPILNGKKMAWYVQPPLNPPFSLLPSPMTFAVFSRADALDEYLAY